MGPATLKGEIHYRLGVMYGKCNKLEMGRRSVVDEKNKVCLKNVISLSGTIDCIRKIAMILFWSLNYPKNHFEAFAESLSHPAMIMDKTNTSKDMKRKTIRAF